MLDILMKRPVDQLDYDVDFSRWLVDGDEIVSVVTQVMPPDSMVSVVQAVPLDGIVKVWLIDGIVGKTATILVTATTAQNRVKQVEFQIRVKD